MLHEQGDRYFDTEEKIETLRAELLSWKNTPYKHCVGVKGAGVDCIFYVLRTLEAVGATNGKRIYIPPYPKDWHLHRGEQLLKEGIERELELVMIGERKGKFLLMREDIADGDIILYKFGRHAAHCGIYLGKQVHQTLSHSGVETRSWNDSDMKPRTTYVYKVVR